jgi:hypothetical protein
MKNTTLLKSLIVIASIAFYTTAAVAGGPKLKSGDVKKLAGQTTLKVQYDYSKMRVGDMSEEAYVSKKVNEYNAKEKGKGDKWKEGWEGARLSRYQPQFLEVFNKAGDGKISISENADNAKYTLIVKVVFIEPGFNVGVMKKPAFVNFEYKVVETANPTGKPVLEVLHDKVPGSQYGGYDFDAGTRIAESFGKGGKDLAKFFLKGLKK